MDRRRSFPASTSPSPRKGQPKIELLTREAWEKEGEGEGGGSSGHAERERENPFERD